MEDSIHPFFFPSTSHLVCSLMMHLGKFLPERVIKPCQSSLPHQPAFLDPCSQTKSSRSRPLGNRPVWKPGHLQAFIWNYNQLCLEWFLLKLRSLNILRLSLCFNMVSAEIPLVFECILFCEIWFTVCPIKFQFHWLREELWLMHACNSENSIIQQTALVKRSDRSPRHLERTQISMTSYSFV